MSLKSSCIQELYADNLIVISKQTNESKQPIATCLMSELEEKKYQNRTKNILQYNYFVVLKTNDTRHFEHNDFLLSIIKSCKINLSEMLFVNYNYKLFTKEELTEMQEKIFIVFDISPQDFFIPVPIQEYIEYKDKQKNLFLFAHSLEDLKPHPENKKKLWMVLKKIFNVL